MRREIAAMDLDVVLDEALGWFEAFRRLHFTPDEIKFGIGPTEIWMVVERGECRFIGVCGPKPEGVTEEEIGQAWVRKGRWWNKIATDKERDRIYSASFPRNHAFELLDRLKAKGFRV